MLLNDEWLLVLEALLLLLVQLLRFQVLLLALVRVDYRHLSGNRGGL